MTKKYLKTPSLFYSQIFAAWSFFVRHSRQAAAASALQHPAPTKPSKIPTASSSTSFIPRPIHPPKETPLNNVPPVTPRRSNSVAFSQHLEYFASPRSTSSVMSSARLSTSTTSSIPTPTRSQHRGSGGSGSGSGSSGRGVSGGEKVTEKHYAKRENNNVGRRDPEYIHNDDAIQRRDKTRSKREILSSESKQPVTHKDQAATNSSIRSSKMRPPKSPVKRGMKPPPTPDSGRGSSRGSGSSRSISSKESCSGI